MYLNRATILGLTIALVSAGGCQPPDVGQACQLLDTAVPSGPVATDYFATGVTACDNLICIKSPANPSAPNVKNNPYCSKQCVSNADCAQGETGLVCRPVVLDDAFINVLKQKLAPEVLDKYLGTVRSSNFCAIPLL